MAEKDTLSKLKEQERKQRKNLIIDAAERVFSTKPYDKVSMREIAEEAGIGTSSIYTYFPNQENLFLESALREINTFTAKMIKIKEENISNEAKLDQLINSFIDYIATHESYFRMMVLFMTQGNLHPDSLASLNAIMRDVFDCFDNFFTNLSYKGNVRKLSHFFFATLNGILVTYRKLPGRDEKEVIKYMKELGAILKEMIIKSS